MRLQAACGGRAVAYATCLDDARKVSEIRRDRQPEAHTRKVAMTVQDGVGNAAPGEVTWIDSVNQTAIVTDRLPDGTVRVVLVPYYYAVDTDQE